MGKTFNIIVTDCSICPYSDSFADVCLHEDAPRDIEVSYLEVPTDCPELMSENIEQEAPTRYAGISVDTKSNKAPLRWKG